MFVNDGARGLLLQAERERFLAERVAARCARRSSASGSRRGAARRAAAASAARKKER